MSQAAHSGDRRAFAKEVAATADGPPGDRQLVRELFASTDSFDQPGIDDPERERFQRFCDVVTYRWLEPKPEEWHPVPDHALDWHDKLHRGDYSPMILAGRKHTKTTWALCEILDGCQYTPYFSVLYWCNNAENQLPARMGELEELIEENLWLDNLHRGKPDQMNNVPQGVKQKDFPGNGSTVYGTSVGGGIEGSHVNLIVGDDPLKEQGDISDEDIMDFYLKVIVQMADSADLNVIVGTRKRPKDIYHLIRKRTEELTDQGIRGYRLIEYPAVREVWLDKYGDRPGTLADADLYTTVEVSRLADGLGLEIDTLDVLWPEARGAEFLLGKLARSGRAAFVREYSMVFTHVKDAIIKRDLVDRDPVSIHPDAVEWDAPPTRTDAEAFLAEYVNEPGFEFDRVAVGLDPAVVEGGDNCAWSVGGQWRNHLFHLYTTYINGIQPERMRETTIDLYDRYEADVIVAEKNGLDWYMDRHVKFPSHLPIRKHNTGAAKHSWTRGVPAIASGIEDGLWRFFRGHEGTEDLIDGLCSIRMDDNDQLAGHTPDVVMALYMVTKGLGSGEGAVLDLSPDAIPEEKRTHQQQKEAREAEKERALEEGGPIGQAILDMGHQRQRRPFG